MYYLLSRYYDPAVGRFINADGYASTGREFIGYNMFAYCNSNPIKYIDPQGGEPISLTILGVSALAIVGIAGFALVTSTPLLYESSQEVYVAKGTSPKKKPVNLPSWKKLDVNIEHIASGHMPNGSRNPDDKKSVFIGVTTHQMVKAIYEAYNHSSKLATVGSRVKLSGFSPTFNIFIEMWVNLAELIIETAYPKG